MVEVRKGQDESDEKTSYAQVDASVDKREVKKEEEKAVKGGRKLQ